MICSTLSARCSALVRRRRGGAFVSSLAVARSAKPKSLKCLPIDLFGLDPARFVIGTQAGLVNLAGGGERHGGDAGDAIGQPPVRHLAAQDTDQRLRIERLARLRLDDEQGALAPFVVRSTDDG